MLAQSSKIANRISLLLLATALVLPTAAASESWRPVPGNLMTQWAEEVTPDCPLPEYPRPQMVRENWVNLNGLWNYAIVDKEAPQPESWDGSILVPFAVESALSGVKKPLTGEQRLWYHRTFACPDLSDSMRLLLHFGGVDWETKVMVNGKNVGEHRGGYDAFSFDITEAVKRGADNELVLSIFDETGGYQPKGKQNFRAIANPAGIMYTPCSGIWQTVWLEPVPATHIRDLNITPDLDRSAVRVTAVTSGERPDAVIEVSVLDQGQEVATGSGKANEPMTISVPDAKLWSPDSPFLYDLSVRCQRGGDVLDSVTSYFGMRKISTAKDEDGFVRILLNNEFIFQIGFLDQGFWPGGIYTAPTDEALRYDVEMTKKLGMNMARKHVKIEPERWYYWCDKLGLLVWQDMPAGGFGRGAGKDKETGQLQDGRAVSAEAGTQFEAELKSMVEQFRNHPSIIMWIVFNEGWGQHDTPRLTRWVKQLDPSRLASNASGWHDIPAGDIIDGHAYPGPRCPEGDGARAPVLGEFGGLGLPVPGHTWVEKAWGYRNLSDAEELTRKYCDLLRKVYELKDTEGLNAAVYTQTTDIETECNGLLTYDRLLKPNLEKVAAANRGVFPRPPRIETVVPTSEAAGLEWSYTFDKPADDWFQVDFDASQWKRGPGGFGTRGTPGAAVGTEWKGSDIWLRREVILPDPPPADLHLLLHHDEDAEVYVNGALAAQQRGYTTQYELTAIKPQAKSALKSGANVIAIHCRQTAGGQYIDAGLVRVIEPPLPADETR